MSIETINVGKTKKDLTVNVEVHEDASFVYCGGVQVACVTTQEAQKDAVAYAKNVIAESNK